MSRKLIKLVFMSVRGIDEANQNRFSRYHRGVYDVNGIDEPDNGRVKTQVFYDWPKNIVNKVDSPDVGMTYSVNAYQGCEHGCAYCYARNSHEYWGFNSGIDFESKIIVKRNAATLLEKHLNKRNWTGETISISGNTDCYQPMERKYQLTRHMLKVCLKYRQSVGIITKNALIVRDLDLLEDLSKMNLVKVYFSINSVNEDTRRKLEPRTATVKKKLWALETLSKLGIPCGVMVAPVIPGLNDHEIPKVLEAVREAGALKASFLMVRLNGAIGPLFEAWCEKNFPDRKDKIINQIKSIHGGKLNDSRFGTRMKGEGKLAEITEKLFKTSYARLDFPDTFPELDKSLFRKTNFGQMDMF